MSVKVVPTEAYLEAVRKLPPNRGKAANAALVKFLREPSLNSLKFRPLAARPNYFIINAVHGDRIILRKDGAETYAAVDVGPHDNVYRRWNR